MIVTARPSGRCDPLVRDDDGPHLPLHVPTEVHRRPRGAAVAADGTGACVSCGERFPLRVLDVVGTGYRCIRCTEQAEVAALEHGDNIDASAHLSPKHRADLRASGNRRLAIGLALLVLFVPAFLACLELGIGGHLPGLMLVGGIGFAITGWARRQAAGA